MEHLHNTLIKFSQVAHEQEEKGIAKYGKPLDPADDYDWIEMAIEEQVDGFKYLLAEKRIREFKRQKRKLVIDKIRQAIKTDVSPKKHDEITRSEERRVGKECKYR